MRASISRIITVSAALCGLGIVCGAVLGSIAILVEDARLPGITAPGDLPGLALVGAIGGAFFGAMLAPTVAWLFLRRVSFGRAIGETATGVVIGIAAGAVIRPQFTISLALLGFVAAAVRLWLTTRVPSRQS